MAVLVAVPAVSEGVQRAFAQRAARLSAPARHALLIAAAFGDHPFFQHAGAVDDAGEAAGEHVQDLADRRQIQLIVMQLGGGPQQIHALGVAGDRGKGAGVAQRRHGPVEANGVRDIVIAGHEEERRALPGRVPHHQPLDVVARECDGLLGRG